MKKKHLPVSISEMKEYGWGQLDFIIISGDAYVDHPSFGVAIISRVLEAGGYRVGIIPQPDWKDTVDFNKLGKPRLAYLVSAGNLDSMVNHYSVNKKKRKKDAYSPNGKMGKRPDRATIVYCNRIREVDKEANIIIGGIEASLRRFSHYDYWQDKIRKSVLIDSRADLLIYGMAENTLIEVAEYLDKGVPLKSLKNIRGTVCVVDEIKEKKILPVEIPSHNELTSNKKKYAESVRIQYQNSNPFKKNVLYQKTDNRYIKENPASLPLDTEEMDYIYSLPYTREFHPMYLNQGGVPALDEVKFSIAANRGCFGGCSFCALTVHQGKIIQKRSKQSIVDEAKKISEDKDFKGYIHDIGGPTANFRNPACEKQFKYGSCVDKDCLTPEPCKNLKVSHEEYLDILQTVRTLPKIKKVFIRSGIRFDYLMLEKNNHFFNELIKHHISGQLKVAPEHCSDSVLKYMNKPRFDVYKKFKQKYTNVNKKFNMNQYIVPYFISSHPGCTLEDSIMLFEYIKTMKHSPEQVQDFYPTPGTVATAMYYSGIDIFTNEKIYVAKKTEEKQMQRALLQPDNPRNRKIIIKALKMKNRFDLIDKYYSGNKNNRQKHNIKRKKRLDK
jgi:uncharacterized radical SAM protein YgiQ